MFYARSCALVTFLALASSLALGAPAQDGAPPRTPGGAATGEGSRDPGTFVDRLMAGDADGDGTLSRSELPGGLGERIFEQADANKDGVLEREELLVFARTQSAGRGEGRGGARGSSGQALSFDGGMRQAGRAFKALGRSQLDATTMADDLVQVQALQAGLLASKAQVASVPMSAEANEKFSGDHAAFEREFRRQLVTALQEAIVVELAILADKSDEAKAALGRLDSAKDSGHALFQDNGDAAPPTAPAPASR